MRDAFPTVELERRDTVDTTWSPITPRSTLVWKARAGQHRQSWYLHLCRIEDETWRLGIAFAGAYDVIAYPSLAYIVRGLVVEYASSLYGAQPSGTDSTLCGVKELHFEEKTHELRAFDQRTGESTVIQGTWPAGRPDVRVAEPGRTWLFVWPGAAYAVDLRTNGVTRVDAPVFPRTPLGFAVPGYTECFRSMAIGRFVMVGCLPSGRNSTLLYDPGEHSIRLLDGATSVTATARGPFSISDSLVSKLLDVSLGRYVRLATGSLAVGDQSDQGRHWFDAFDEDRRELRRYDLESASYEVIRRYDRNACRGMLGVQKVRVVERQRRYVVVGCVAPLPTSSLDANQVWTEVLDLEARRVWHTPRWVEQITPDGKALVSDLRVADSTSDFQLLWVVDLAAAP